MYIRAWHTCVTNSKPMVVGVALEKREEEFFWGVKIFAAIIILLILIAALYKYWSNFSSSGGQTVAGSSVTSTGAPNTSQHIRMLTYYMYLLEVTLMVRVLIEVLYRVDLL
uniref:Uncharacterized protein n=1 Tax=Quercus lobata TaxID=97700 RepID=A0A7N2R651_QUELO